MLEGRDLVIFGMGIGLQKTTQNWRSFSYTINDQPVVSVFRSKLA
jgi:hypothetical protein